MEKNLDLELELLNEKRGKPLTEREFSVLEHVVKGESNTKIAKKLSISVHTVKAHISSIMQKMAVTDRVQAAVKAVREGMV